MPTVYTHTIPQNLSYDTIKQPLRTQWNEHTMTETGWYTSHTYICYKWNVPTVHVKHTQINNESIAWWVPALIFAPNIYINMYRCEQISAQVLCFIFGRGSFTVIPFFSFFFFFFFSQNNHKLLLDMSIQGYHFAVQKKKKKKGWGGGGRVGDREDNDGSITLFGRC